MAAELVVRMAILVAVRHFLGIGVAYSRSLRFDNYVRMHHFARRTTSIPFRRFLGDVRREFLLLFMVLWVSISATLCMRAVLILWHALMFLGLRFVPLSLFLLGGLR
jgi:hypothetical protein